MENYAQLWKIMENFGKLCKISKCTLENYGHFVIYTIQHVLFLGMTLSPLFMYQE